MSGAARSGDSAAMSCGRERDDRSDERGAITDEPDGEAGSESSERGHRSVDRAPEAVHGLNADPAASALAGDSFTDIEAAHFAGVASIGYAHTPGKLERMAQLHAGVVITSMPDLALSLRAYPYMATL